MIPKDWTLTSLGCVSSIITKGATPTTYGYDFVEKSTGAVRFLGAYNCSSDGNFKSDSVKWISRDADDMLKRSRLMAEDSIFCIVGNTIGASFIVEKKILPANINQNVALIRVIKDLAHPKYIHYCLRSSYIQWQVKQEASTQAQPSLSLKQVSDFRINLPPIHEQLKITAIISTWDKAIATTEQLLANSQQQKKALMRQLLTGEKRLAGFKQAWNKVKVSKMGSISSGGTPDTTNKEYWDGGINWLTPTDVTSLKSRYVFSTNKTISEKGLKNSSAKILPRGALLICTRATIGAMAISTTEIATNQGFKNLVPNAEFSVEFLYYLFTFNVKELVRKSSGSTFLELSKSDFEKLTFLCPCLDEQHKIASVLIAADDTIALQQQKLHYLKQEKKALMQQLLTGKCRVKVEAA